MKLSKLSMAVLGCASLAAGVASAADAPAVPTLKDVLGASGITATGYVKAAFTHHAPVRTLFAQDRPVLLYTPHWQAHRSSWPAWGREIVAMLVARTDWNVILAPHQRLIEQAPDLREVLAKVAGLTHVHCDLDSFAARIRTAVIAAVALMFAVAVAANVLVTRRTVGRIEQINATSRAIMQSGLDKRIPLRGSHDEWDRVAENLNLMLDRIEMLMGEVKQVSDNVAHDLRTPLTRMRGRLEKAYHGARSGEADQALIGDTIADLDAVLRIFASIVRIAHIETQARKGAFRAVNLMDIAGEVVELYDAAAEQDGTRLTLAGDRNVLVTGDRDLIFDAIANLVDNAIKHGRAGGQVAVTSRSIDGQAVISIADDGPGIPRCEHEQVFKRFYRLEQSRYTPGNGLGLSLVSAVARLHGARIEMLDTAPGLTFRLYFPPLSA